MTPEDFSKHGDLTEEKVFLAAVAHYGELSNGIQTRRYVRKRSGSFMGCPFPEPFHLGSLNNFYTYVNIRC